jgi:UDP-sulfoquinovose synthase
MRVLILGGDGYLGWPTAMHFSSRGHEVHAMDNYLRRRIHRRERTGSLTPIAENLPARAAAWKQVTGREIGVTEGDLLDWVVLDEVFREFAPEAIVHYGEMPSAPYSMKDRASAFLTQQNNVLGTLNVLWAIREHVPDAHLVKLGTMGEYGTPNIDIEEGWIDIQHNGRSDRMPYPKRPASLYHCTKVHDSVNIEFCCRAWGLRATDLNQGVVYGIETPETVLDERLMTRFDYDEAFGTALNRFCVEAVIGLPLTVYGTGDQTRGYLNIVDTLQCVELAVQNPAEPGEFRVFNQFTQQFSINELADIVRRAGADLGFAVNVAQVENPRIEAEEHYYNARHTGLLELGLRPHLLSETLVESMLAVIDRHRDRVIVDHILPQTRWRPPSGASEHPGAPGHSDVPAPVFAE